MDEPCSALDPTSTRRIEETIAELREQVTIVIVTHNMQQAHARVAAVRVLPRRRERARADRRGRADRDRCSSSPEDPRTLDYVTRPVRMTTTIARRARPRPCGSRSRTAGPRARRSLVAALGARRRPRARREHRRRGLDVEPDRGRPVARRRRAPGPLGQLPGRRLHLGSRLLLPGPDRLRGVRDPVPARRTATATGNVIDRRGAARRAPPVRVHADRRRRHVVHVPPRHQRAARHEPAT